MMKSNHEEVCFVMSDEVDDGVHLLAFQEMSLEFDSFAQCGLARLGMQSFIGLCTITVDDQLQRRVGSVGIGRKQVAPEGWLLPAVRRRVSWPGELRRLAHVQLREIRYRLPRFS
jgi:hypothetical protein